MPTEIHNLGREAAVYTGPNSRTLSASMAANEYAMNLQKYCISAGLSPLASEWWHFNDHNGRVIATNHGITGDFFTETIYSTFFEEFGNWH
jgi:D-alanyl-D-alanine dipeptidase